MFYDNIISKLKPLLDPLGWGELTKINISSVGVLRAYWDSSAAIDELTAIAANNTINGPTYILDPDTGKLCRHLALMPAIWMRSENLRNVLTSQPTLEDKNRLMDILGAYLASGRLQLHAGANWYYVGCRVWPVLQNLPAITDDIRHQFIKILLLRAGAHEQRFFVHASNTQANNIFLSLERCFPVINGGLSETRQQLQNQIRLLAKEAAEDRKIIELLLDLNNRGLNWDI
ncbi:hypothetical protein TI05_06410 [Achromatium sp. WMS3]|nr:hypothetical protein TI05_06410 [Achromatium sp. WMS3]